jgi:hypothetical protein
MALDPTIPLGVKPIDFLGSAGNLLNLARGAQALQQEQTLNPIQAEKARIELGIARDTQAAEIARQKALSGTAVTGEKAAGKAFAGSVEQTLRDNFAPLIQLNSFANPAANPQAAIKDVISAKERAIAAGVPADAAEYFAASLYSQIAKAKEAGDPTPVKEWMFRNLMASQTPSAQQQLMAPAGAPNVSAGGVPGYAVAEPGGNRFAPLQVGPRPTTPAEGAPLSEGVTTGAIQTPKTIIQRTQVGESALTPPVTPGLAAISTPMQPAAPAQPQGVTAGAMSMPGLRYPKREPGQPFIPVQGEEPDRAIGQKYVGDLVAMQPAMTTARRSIEEVIDKANKIQQQSYFQAGAAGSMERNVRGFFGSEDYKQLSKDLANVQIGMIQSKGGSLDTVSGQALARHANGDETYPPNVLKSIARRSYADVLATELEGRAAANFAQNFGDANHNAFKQTWSKNADSRIFEIMALPKLIQDKAERVKVANEILKNATPKEREEFNRKYQNILRLEQTGSL